MLGEGGIGGVGKGLGKNDLGPLRFVHEFRQFLRQQPGAVGSGRRAIRAFHREDQAGEGGQAWHRLNGGRQVEGAGQIEWRLIQRAESGDAGEQQRLAV